MLAVCAVFVFRPNKSALGQKQTFALHQPMSALPPKADMCSATRHVRFVPKAEILQCNSIAEICLAPDEKTTLWCVGLSEGHVYH